MKFDIIQLLIVISSLTQSSQSTPVLLERRLINPTMGLPNQIGTGNFKNGDTVGGGFFFNPFSLLNPGGGGMFGDVFNFFKFTKGDNGVDVNKVNGNGGN